MAKDRKNVIDESLYYSPSKLLSYNRVLNFVIGARGVGKTYGWTEHVIKRFLNKGEQFIYLRRYKTELQDIDTFFNAIIASGKYDDHRFEVKGKDFYIDDTLAGYAIPLSIAVQKKSVSYPVVTTIIFDEFLIEKGNIPYITNEPSKLLNFMDTVIRNRDDCNVVCLSNAVTVANPYFLYFKIDLNIGEEFTAYPDFLVQIPKTAKFTNERQKTRAGRLFRHTPYGSFALDNEFVGDNTDFIGKRTPYAKFMGCVRYNKLVIGFWLDYQAGYIYANSEYDPSAKPIAINKDDHGESTYMIDNWKNSPILNMIVRAYKQGYLLFEDQPVKHTCYDMLNSFNLR